jgi:hypothetical protein
MKWVQPVGRLVYGLFLAVHRLSMGCAHGAEGIIHSRPQAGAVKLSLGA